ncbi:TrmJ/YjtD family RNA methyltransferase [Candidatus Woesearchaeota archaeon]|nr:TrmJ/YjtD family RNA methyltransferase [Candidatus Woesearchaeota archaeon]
MQPIAVAMMEPEYPDNLGYIARAMKNFDFNKLILVAPKAKKDSVNAVMKAKYAKDILERAVLMKDMQELKQNFDYIIGTTAVLGTDYNIPRLPLAPPVLAEKIVGIKGKLCILLGRDGSGLTNKEIEQCDFLVTIPTSREYKTLNIAHAAAIIFYEIAKKSNEDSIISHIKPITAKEKEVIMKLVDEVISSTQFTTEGQKQTQRELWQRLIGKSLLTRREAFCLMGFLRKMK